MSRAFACADCGTPLPAPATEWFTPARPYRCERCRRLATFNRELKARANEKIRRAEKKRAARASDPSIRESPRMGSGGQGGA